MYNFNFTNYLQLKQKIIKICVNIQKENKEIKQKKIEMYKFCLKKCSTMLGPFFQRVKRFTERFFIIFHLIDGTIHIFRFWLPYARSYFHSTGCLDIKLFHITSTSKLSFQ